MVNDKVVINYHDDTNYSVGETDEGCYVYDKKVQKLYSLSLDSFNKLLIKLAATNINDYGKECITTSIKSNCWS